MKIKEELRTFTDDAHRLSLKMIGVVDSVNLGITSAVDGSKELDRVARDLAAVTDSIKDLAYRLGRGEDRVTTIGVAS